MTAHSRSFRTALLWIALFVLALLVWSVLPRSREARDEASNVVLQVRQLRNLSTVRYTVQKVVTLEEQKQPFGSERILLIVQARVDAGVNLAALAERDVELRHDGSVVIRLPQAEILTAAIDEKETRVWDRSKTWWTPWVPFSNDLEKKARMQGLEAARATAVEMGILKQAEAGAAEAIRSLLSLSGQTRVTIIPGSAT